MTELTNQSELWSDGFKRLHQGQRMQDPASWSCSAMKRAMREIHVRQPRERAMWQSHEGWIIGYTQQCADACRVRCDVLAFTTLRVVTRYCEQWWDTAWSGEVLSAVVRYYVLLRGTSYNGYTVYSGWAMRTVARYYVEWRGSACKWRGNACEWSYISIKLSRVEKGFRLDILWAYSDGGTKC